uniref:Transcription initiation factor TFIID subunit 13 n=1 Tax=Panagrellus redivivus TaxID=6233 RepID=A0A7E4V1G4_PANRE
MAKLGMDEPSLFESEEEEETEESGAKKPAEDKTQQLRRELKTMLFGFGDVKEPLDETVDALHDIVIDYITSVCKKAVSLNAAKKLTLEDIHFLIRRDVRKYTRVRELLSMSELLKKARKDFESSEI